MAGFIARQPNGLLCRHSTVTDCLTDYNMTEEDYINMCKEKAEEEAKDIIKKCMRDFSEVKERFVPNNMSKKRFSKILKEMERPAKECKAEKTW